MKTAFIPALAAIATVAVFASTGVRADEADASQFVHQSQGVQSQAQAANAAAARSRLDVQAEALQRSRTWSPEPAGSRIGAPMKSDTARQSVRRAGADWGF